MITKRVYNFKPEEALHQINHYIRRIVSEYAPTSKLLLPITSDPASYIAAYVLWHISPDRCRFVCLQDNHHTEVMDTIIKKMNEDFFDENFSVIDTYNECRNLYKILNEVEFSKGVDTVRWLNTCRGFYLLHHYDSTRNPLLIDSSDAFSRLLGIGMNNISIPIFSNLYYGEIIEIGKCLDLDEKIILDAYERSYEINLIEEDIKLSLKDIHESLRLNLSSIAEDVNDIFRKFKPVSMKVNDIPFIRISTFFDQK